MAHMAPDLRERYGEQPSERPPVNGLIDTAERACGLRRDDVIEVDVQSYHYLAGEREGEENAHTVQMLITGVHDHRPVLNKATVRGYLIDDDGVPFAARNAMASISVHDGSGPSGLSVRNTGNPYAMVQRAVGKAARLVVDADAVDDLRERAGDSDPEPEPEPEPTAGDADGGEEPTTYWVGASSWG